MGRDAARIVPLTVVVITALIFCFLSIGCDRGLTGSEFMITEDADGANSWDIYKTELFSREDGWDHYSYGSELPSFFLVVVRSDNTSGVHQPTYNASGGRYEQFIPAVQYDEGDRFYITENYLEGELHPEYSLTLPPLEEKTVWDEEEDEDDDIGIIYLLCLVPLGVLILIIIMIIVVIILVRRKRK
jgi:hypothetical protein